MKAIILAAGYGTRCLPATKTVPKELLPIGCVPAIQFIIDELVASGISDVVVVSSRRKKALEDYFDREIELEAALAAEGKGEALSKIARHELNAVFVRQERMLGTGHALLSARAFIGDEPCVVVYPDDLHMGEPPLALQLVREYERTGCCVLSSIKIEGDVSRYGVLDVGADGKVAAIVEKPRAGHEPSREVSIGRYLVAPEFFYYLEEGWRLHLEKAKAENRALGEYYHIYALNKLMAQGKVVRKIIEGERLDTGDPAGYLDAVLRYAETRPELRAVLERRGLRATLGQGKETALPQS